MSSSGCILVFILLSCILGLSVAGYDSYGHGGHGGHKIIVYKTSHGGHGHGGGYGHGHDYKTHAIKGPTYLVKTVHHIKKIHPGGHYLGHYSHGGHGHGHGHGHGGGHGGYGKVIVIKGHSHGYGHGHGHGHGGGHGGYEGWW